MQKEQAHDSDPVAPENGAPATPRASGERPGGVFAEDTPLPESNTRSAQLPDAPSVPSEPTDTLLSAGKPADRLELLLEDRLAAVDERLRDLDARLSGLERRKSTALPEQRLKPWLWLAFLIALAVVFQLLHALQ